MIDRYITYKGFAHNREERIDLETKVVYLGGERMQLGGILSVGRNYVRYEVVGTERNYYILPRRISDRLEKYTDDVVEGYLVSPCND